jgi:predicted MFS family arabinose efflux permease
MQDSSARNEAARRAGYIDALARREFFVVCAAGLLYSVTQNYSALLAVVFAASGHPLPTIGLLLSLFAFPALVGTLGSSAIAARIGVLPAVRLAALCTALGIGSLAITRSDFSLAVLSRLVQGLGVGLLLPVLMTYVQSRLNRARFIYLVTAFSAVIPLAAAIAPPLGEWTFEHYGATALFIEAAIPALLCSLLTLPLRPMARPQAARGLGLSAALRRRFILPVAAVVTGGALYGFTLSYLAPDLLSRGIPLAAFFVPSTVALLMSRFVAMRSLQALRPASLVAMGLVLSAIGLGLAVIATGIALAMLAGLALGAGNSVMFPVVAAWMSEGFAAQERAGPQAIAATAFYFGIYAMPYPETFMVGAWGYGGAEAALAALACAVALLLVSASSEKRPAAPL